MNIPSQQSDPRFRKHRGPGSAPCSESCCVERSDLLCRSTQPLAFCPRWERTALKPSFEGFLCLKTSSNFIKLHYPSQSRSKGRFPLAPNWKLFVGLSCFPLIWFQWLGHLWVFLHTLACSVAGVTEVERKTLQYTLDHMKYTTKATFDFLKYCIFAIQLICHFPGCCLSSSKARWRKGAEGWQDSRSESFGMFCCCDSMPKAMQASTVYYWGIISYEIPVCVALHHNLWHAVLDKWWSLGCRIRCLN